MLKRILLLHLLLFVSCCAFAQFQSLSKEQMKQVKIDNLSDDQVRQLAAEMKKNNIPFDDIDKYAVEKGISADEASKLKDRMRVLGLDKELTAKGDNAQSGTSKQSSGDREYEIETDQSATAGVQRKLTPAEQEKEKKKKRIFGAELFSNKNLTFEPNLRMATPPNYRIASGDEIIVDVYGYSEVQHKLKVTPEGYIRVPYLGPVYVNGLTMKEATDRLTKQLSSIYGGIKSGNTYVQVSLGNIRSIRVLLIGEIESPGSYTLPSLASVANALYVSGGPSENGSFRDIQVIRNGTRVATFDLYDFLLNGDLSNNIILQDQDIVKVNPYKTRVELLGEVKRPAIFEAKDNETLQTILNYAGGFTDKSFPGNIRAFRVNNKEREVVNVPAEQIATFHLKSGDQFFVDSILSRFSNRVIISGAVFHPGQYALEPGMTIGDLIRRADGIQEVAALTRGVIRRLQPDFTPAMISFNVQEAVEGRNNLVLQKEDSVVIFSKLGLRQEYNVKISGEVNNPGVFNFADSMQLEDLILLAGGLKDAASLKHVEVSRRIRKQGSYDSTDTRMAIIQQFDVNADLSSGLAATFTLQPFDEVSIRRAPGYAEQANVQLDGEVLYSGQYAINSKRERISDLIKRAGGLKPEAYAEGAVLLRKTYVNVSDSALLTNKLEVFYNKLQDSSDIARMKNAVERKEQLLGINLDEILAKPGSKYDLLLEEGDIIKVPKKLQTVQLFGEIYFPKKVRFDRNATFRDYVRGAGGFTSSALRRRSYIVYANGEVKSARKVLMFTGYPKVKPGAEIYVPTRKERRGLSGQEILGMGSVVASIALVIATIINNRR
ncbi:SLBB domain-containing protein [Chitinophaga pendula]|uniref:SLBB domain-containing protein n=1 Tax=Chitinophaga TaxID=79328 RepID=UPI000BB08E34|nr:MULTISPECIES: SLBB domain-containing protein [Chitinophaga]ASZ10687.1 capsule biosynthesis protein [Chitinophaga sp. MD30]UCJ06340.1 SLBB domain-containing protein [Chitinophaga pendula]